MKGALSQPNAEKFNLAKFHGGSRVQARFFNNFQIAYDSLQGVPKAETADADKKQGEAAAGTADAATALGKEVAAQEKKKSEVTKKFRKACEQSCQAEIEGRVVMLLAEGSQAEINASITNTRLYQNLTDAATVMGFYDVKKREAL